MPNHLRFAWLQVLLARVFRLGVRGDLSSRLEVQAGQLYLEVTAPAAEGEHSAPCEAIGEHHVL